MIFALIGAVLIGLSLGVLGSGGSIITVPVLTYLVGQDEKIAIAGSLAIVGTISLFASIPYARKGFVDGRSILFFGVPGMAGAYLGAYLSVFVSGAVQLGIFAILMLLAAVLMLRPLKEVPAEKNFQRSPLKIAADGLVVGIITGFVGVGGGFLIVPALVLLGGLSMRRAVGTSLLIIALKSYAGFAKYLDVLDDLELELDWQVLATFSVLGIAGSFIGNAMSSKLPQEILKKAFAYFLFVVGIFIVVKNWSEMLPSS